MIISSVMIMQQNMVSTQQSKYVVELLHIFAQHINTLRNI